MVSQKKNEKSWKKALTFEYGCGIIHKRSRERARKTSEKVENRNLTGERKRPQKNLKKCLTNELECDKIVRHSREERKNEPNSRAKDLEN